MLNMLAFTLGEVIRHAVEAYPHECCGLLLGPAGGPPWQVTQVRRAKNLDTERARDRYLMDPRDRIAVEDAARAAGLAVVGFYHSHPDHDAYFSKTDLERSEEYQWGEPWVPPTYAYLVLSAPNVGPCAWKAFMVEAGESREVPVHLQ